MSEVFVEEHQPNILDQDASWKEDKERIILFADIMGFKDRVVNTTHSDLKEDLLSFIIALKRKIKPLLNGDYMRYVQFSDSIIIVVNGTSSRMFNIITKAAVCLMHGSMSHGFPIKGVIASGLFTFDEEDDLYFGKPLVDAYLLHEEIYYYGIVVHHSAEYLIKKYDYLHLPYCKEKVPLKGGKTSHYHLSWQFFKKNLDVTDNIPKHVDKWLSVIEEHVSGSPRIYVDNTREVISNDNFHKNAVNKQLSERTSPSL